jgi:magnesium-transporting ATPase (P-type)
MTKNKGEQPSDGHVHVSGQSNRPMSRPAHALTVEQLATELNADTLSGLAAAEAKVRLEQYGRNDLGEEGGVQPFKIVIAQIANAMTLVTVPILPPREVDILIRG